MTYNEAVSYLTDLYRTHLGRAPDTGGLDFWASALVNGIVTPASVAATFASSPEATYYSMYLDSTVKDLYWSEVGRLPDTGGLAFYVDLMRKGTSAETIESYLHDSQEAASYRASLPIVPQPDPRLSQMQNFNTNGNAIVEYRRGDRLDTLAKQAYGSSDYWWVIAQGNNVISDRELGSLSQVVIPDIRQSSVSYNAIAVDDNGYGILYVNRFTGDQWGEYYVPAVSQLEPLEFEENPLWLDGLAFVNGNDFPGIDFRMTRAQPYITMPPDYWAGVKESNSIGTPIEVNLPTNLDTAVLNQLPIVYGVPDNPQAPPPRVLAANGADPAPAVHALKKYPSQITTTLQLSQVKIVAVKRTVVEYFPHLNNVQVPGWPPGKTWNLSPGVFSEWYKTVGYATAPDAMRAGSESLFDHELAHAYDWAMGGLSQSPMFVNAFQKDFQALVRAETVVQYFSKADNPEAPASQRTYVRAQKEAYAESFANYYSGKTRWFADKPALLKYFRSLPRPVQPGQR